MRWAQHIWMRLWKTDWQLRKIYRQQQIEHLGTSELCAPQGISYQPMVFTARGGCDRHAEAVISQTSKAVAKCENPSQMDSKAEPVQRISLSLARSASKAIERRRSKHCTATWVRCRRHEAESVLEADGCNEEDETMA